ncbi:hypothetical protein BC936DRAFT_139520 [Jimgerdemannia flammicorona]|uniref:Uncharacterized protein n=1 Tax=Jimgerdemannia flammicorona TaxID=994334 RepID=A0A433B9R6_9FUNG|nr:hypothetical protein BC936DRAFT_139520 [Jimgerdemannia flammicorona]
MRLGSTAAAGGPSIVGMRVPPRDLYHIPPQRQQERLERKSCITIHPMPRRWIRHDPRVPADRLVQFAALVYTRTVRRAEDDHRGLVAIISQDGEEEGVVKAWYQAEEEEPPESSVEILTVTHDLDLAALERGNSVAPVRLEGTAFVRAAEPEAQGWRGEKERNVQEVRTDWKRKEWQAMEIRDLAPEEDRSFVRSEMLEQSGWLEYDRHMQLPPSLFRIPSRHTNTLSEPDIGANHSIPVTYKSSAIQSPIVAKPAMATVGTNTTYFYPNDRPGKPMPVRQRDSATKTNTTIFARDFVAPRRLDATALSSRPNDLRRQLPDTPPLRTEDLDRTAAISLATRDFDPMAIQNDETMWTAPVNGVTYRPLFEVVAVPSVRVDESAGTGGRIRRWGEGVEDHQTPPFDDRNREEDEEEALMRRVSEALTPVGTSMYDERSVVEGQEIIARLVDDPEKTFMFLGEGGESAGVERARAGDRGSDGRYRWDVGETVQEGPTLARITAKYMPLTASAWNAVEGTTHGTDGYSYATLEYLRKFELVNRGRRGSGS